MSLRCQASASISVELPTDGMIQLNDASLFKQNVAYVNGEWVKANSGKTFEVHGISNSSRIKRPNYLMLSIRPIEWGAHRNMSGVHQRGH